MIHGMRIALHIIQQNIIKVYRSYLISLHNMENRQGQNRSLFRKRGQNQAYITT